MNPSCHVDNANKHDGDPRTGPFTSPDGPVKK